MHQVVHLPVPILVVVHKQYSYHRVTGDQELKNLLRPLMLPVIHKRWRLDIRQRLKGQQLPHKLKQYQSIVDGDDDVHDGGDGEERKNVDDVEVAEGPSMAGFGTVTDFP